MIGMVITMEKVAVKERPIIFSGEMVRAILEGETQTRRVKNIPQNALAAWWDNTAWRFKLPDGFKLVRCPYGKLGDRLWVRETWRIGAWNIDAQAMAVDYRADGYARQEWLDVEDDELWERLWIQSSDDAEAAGLPLGDEGFHWEPGQAPTRWRPSIHMPRWASRILLEITDIRVARVQDISEDDAMAEGILAPSPDSIDIGPIEVFADLWDSINAKRGYSWDRNPWVWVIGFRRINEPTS